MSNPLSVTGIYLSLGTIMYLFIIKDFTREIFESPLQDAEDDNKWFLRNFLTKEQFKLIGFLLIILFWLPILIGILFVLFKDMIWKE